MEKKQAPDSLESIAKACDEAEDLLAALDKNDEQQKLPKRESNDSIEPINSTVTRTKTSESGAIGCLWIVAVGIVILIGTALTSQKEDSSNSRIYASQAEYNQAMEAARSAVLVSEHKRAIKKLEEIKQKGINPATMDNGVVNNKIIQAKNAIKFLDQKGKKRYTEHETYGFQWYDKHDSDAYKIFFAYSNKCRSPLITFEYLRGKDGPVIKKRYVRPKTTTSTLQVPYLPNEPGDIWLRIEHFRCN